MADRTDKAGVLERWISQARKGYFEMLLLARLQAGRAYGYQIVARNRFRASKALPRARSIRC